MAFLEVVKGESPGKYYELASDRVVVGRHPSCGIVLDDAAISRRHALIVESHGSYYLEDLRSRNHTYLNGKPVLGRMALTEGDTIKVCGIYFRFRNGGARPDAIGLAAPPIRARISDEKAEQKTVPETPSPPPSEDLLEDSSGTSSIVSTLDAKSGSGLRLSVKPEAKLRAVLEISTALARVLNVDEVLEKTLEGLFKLFPQTDECFAFLHDSQRGKPVIRAFKTRRPRNETSLQVSMTIINQALQTGKAILSADAADDSRFSTSESVNALQIRSMMCVPLLGQSDERLGVVQINTRDLRQPFNKGDLDVLLSVASQISLAVENANLHQELVRQRDFERDLEFATQIQLGFLPSAPPQIKGYEFADYYEAALRVGGDFFDYIQQPDGRVVVALGDVAGKGVPAALHMARLYSSARLHLFTSPNVAAALTNLNSEITASGVGHRFITFLMVQFDPRTADVFIANAGHLPPLLRRSNSEVEIVAQKDSGMPLGVAADQEFREIQIKLEAGDSLTVYTDGITEAMSPDGEIYGRERLRRVIRESPPGAKKLLKSIVSDVEAFSQESTQRDDMCLVCVRRSK